MRITIDASSLLPPRSGVGNYTLCLTQALLELDQVNNYTVVLNSFGRRLPRDPFLERAANAGARALNCDTGLMPVKRKTRPRCAIQ